MAQLQAKTSQKLSNKEAQQLMKWASIASVCVAATVIIMKFIAWTLTDSLSILSSLVDSILDMVISLISLVTIHYALQPADQEHRFGHGRAEDMAAILQSTFIAGSGLFIGIQAIQRFITPYPIESTTWGINIMLLSTIITLCLILFQRYVVSKTQSTLIKTDSIHYLTDLGVNLIIILSLLTLQHTNWHWIDPIVALSIALYIFKSAWNVGKTAFDKLMDREFNETERDQIKTAILSHPNVKGFHDLRTRQSGINPFIQLHLELDGTMTLQEAHTISEQVENNILKDFPNAEIIIHQDPEEDKEIPLIKEGVKSLHKK